MEQEPKTSERSLLSDAELLDIQAALSAGEFITDQQRLTTLAANLKSEEELDPTQTVRELEGCSSRLATLFSADIGLLRIARLGEHTEADLSGFEQDYRQFFPGEPESLQILRFASLVKDSGKSLCNKAEGDNQKQTVYNLVVSDALLDGVDSKVMANDAKEAVRLLVEYDIVGNALQGRFDQATLDELRTKWPVRFSSRLADFVTVSYMSDASAHTAYRSFTDMASGQIRPCVTSQDIAQKATLDFLFESPVIDKTVTLKEPYSRVVNALLPDRQATRSLMHDSNTEEPPLAREYIYKTEADDAWSATMILPPQKYDMVKRQIEEFTMATDVPISAFLKKDRSDNITSVTIVRDPSRRFGTLSPDVYERATEKLKSLFGWQRQLETSTDESDISACVGLLEGYDEETGTLHKPAEALALLLEHGQGVDWQTEPTMLVSVRKVSSESGGVELQSWDEKVMSIRGKRRSTYESPIINPAIDGVTNVASRLNQQRLFLEDRINRQTIALAA